jgi:hypothetical protein
MKEASGPVSSKESLSAMSHNIYGDIKIKVNAWKWGK